MNIRSRAIHCAFRRGHWTIENKLHIRSIYETSVLYPNPSGLGYKTAKTLTQKLKCSIIQCNLLDNTLTRHACAGVVHHCQRWIKQVASDTL